MRRKRLFYRFALFIGELNALPVLLRIAIAYEQIFETFPERYKLVMPCPFVGIQNKER